MYGNHFTFEELVKTETNLPNYPATDSHLSNLSTLWNTLNYLREKFGKPIIINSAYRSEPVNKQIGGAKRSLHKQGRAADIRCAPEYMERLWKLLQSEKDNFSELIRYETFYHIAI